jgi:hypothetical protein
MRPCRVFSKYRTPTMRLQNSRRPSDFAVPGGPSWWMFLPESRPSTSTRISGARSTSTFVATSFATASTSAGVTFTFALGAFSSRDARERVRAGASV